MDEDLQTDCWHRLRHNLAMDMVLSRGLNQEKTYDNGNDEDVERELDDEMIVNDISDETPETRPQTAVTTTTRKKRSVSNQSSIE
ncbi:MAG: hypothetical protein O7C56_04765, partial [Rickettsia endosymbiont of Ixodes persulcatus]|nr:hypothetical protein [Rickettsia endosymbiont of Ixodes persulcatus]